MKRLAHVVSCSLKMGIGSATLVKLFSEFKDSTTSISPQQLGCVPA